MCDVINVFDYMSTWIITPVKRLSDAKSSLSPVLTPSQRRELVLFMLTDVLNAARDAPSLAGFAVVSPDDEVLDFARSKGAECIAEPGLELNEALRFATHHMITKGATSMLIMPADLPLLKSSDIEKIVTMASSSKSVVIAPSNANGTNALFLRPPNIINLKFGGESFPKHVAESIRAGIKPQIYRSQTVSTDIDEINDLRSVEKYGLGTKTHEFLVHYKLIKVGA